MKVRLINYTQDALETLLFTKGTRLKRDSGEISLDSLKAIPMEEKLKELDYILKTIKSSWEFVDYVFEIQGVSRAFTHQFVRTRVGSSFAQQAQRVVDMSNFDFVLPEDFTEEQKDKFIDSMDDANKNYKMLISMDAPPQDARGILPTNACTNIIAKFNLRTLSDMAEKRLCYRTQGEYQRIFKEMIRLVKEIHPWADKFLRVYCAAVGVCQFPNFKECPIKGGIFNPETGLCWNGNELMRPDTLDEIQTKWEQTEYESIPKWKGRS